ncbi:MAG TPA: translation initiation factor IF-2 [Candidatus Anaerotruncus excrementipullorum]|uniref:Translation initiation factor IF-2 n=1 Tax=Candidatus Anaerotruncus excrementipullorum TaxID=2838465 RepID=A0A9D2B6S2_9FIRM|nr:translation initiation factor IF-2 [Candidatus Anaerotruncus excrementipullorum]
MIAKYRVHEVARDLGVSSKEILDLLAQRVDGERKSMTALNEQELSLVLNHYTAQNQVENFDAYFADGERRRKERAAAAPKPEEQPKPKKLTAQQIAAQRQEAMRKVMAQKDAEAKAAQEKAAQEKAAQEKAAQEKAAQEKAAQEKAAQEKAAQQRAPQAPPRPAAQPQQRPAQPQGQRPAQQPRPAGGSQLTPEQKAENLRRERERLAAAQARTAAARQQQGQQRGGRFGDRPQQPGGRPGQPGSQRPAQQGQRPAAQPQQRPAPQPQQQRPAAQQQGQKPRQRGSAMVDMRAGATQVELDRYNEKYDTLAQSKLGNRDVAAQKQKLTQRSAQRRAGKPAMSRKEKEEAKLRKLELERQRRKNLEITLPEEFTVGELAARLHVQAGEVIKRLMSLGVMAAVNDTIDYDTGAMVAIEIGAKVEKEVVLSIEDRLFEEPQDEEANMVERPPVVVVMGHVDHGKTSILDAIRHANVTAGEAGGITQHIGAYQVLVNGRPVTFLDTPGHAAFTAMRARGAQVTDIAVLVVAADDGIMPQTIEAINHAKAAEVSIIVAINKMDKPHANPDKVMQQLTEHGLVPEEWGGDVPCIRVSAKTGEGIADLLEMIQLVADTSELKANPNRQAKGTVIEAKLDKGRGPVATILIQAGTLHTGDAVIAGTTFGRVRVMVNDKGERVDTAGPSTPVEITGLDDAPAAGDVFNAVEDERLAKELVEQRKQEQKEAQFKTFEKVTLDNLFSHIAQGDIKELPIVVKADVQGSVEAVTQSLEKLSNEEVRVKVIHGAVGAVNESDVMLAQASGAVIVGFNVRPDPVAKENAERDGVEIRLYRVIYDAINDVETAMKGMLAPKTREVDLGRAEVRQVYKISGVGAVAGCYVLEGKITRSAEIRVVRDGIIVADDKLASLKRFKDDVKEVAKGYECGMALQKFNDIKEGDVFEAYEIEEYRE